MKVLHLSSETTWRGGEQQIAYLIKESLMAGVDIHVLARAESPFVEWCQSEKVAHDTSSYGLFSFQDLVRTVADFKPDLIHIHSSKSHGLVARASIATGLDVPLIVSRRVDFPLKKNPFSRFKYGLSSIKKFICVSEAIEAMVREGVSRPELACTVRSGIDLSRFTAAVNPNELRERYDISADEKIIANVSAIAPHKDYFTFIDTCLRLKEMGLKARYLIIGDGPERVAIKQYRDEKGLRNDVIMTGFIDDIPQVLPSIDVFLISSKTEGLGTTILDAFACEVPVVATAAGGIPESVIHERTGLLCPVGDSASLAKAVMRICDNDALGAQLAQGAKTHVLSCSKEEMAAKTLAIYNEVLGLK
jgi:glycosyltransferase involved in cell wall biosynthesis